MACPTSIPKHPPNRHLLWARLQRGWSREELVEQIKRSMTQIGERECGLNAEMIRRWETGERRPEPRYKKHLVLVFGVTASELGLLSECERALKPDPAAATVIADEQLVDRVAEKVVSALMGSDGGVSRNLFLKGLLGASLAPLLTAGAAVPQDADALAHEPRTRVDERAVHAYAATTASHRALYWNVPPAQLLSSVVAHVRLGNEILKSASSVEGGQAQQLAAAVSESALLVARIAFFDLARVDLAEPFFQFAEDTVRVSDDHTLATAVFAHRAFVPGFAHDEQSARGFLKVAHAHARYGAGPQLRSWLHCVDAEISARNGQPKTSLARIGSAEEALVTGGTDPQWLDYFDPSRLAGFAGNALLLAGEHRGAAVRLRQALDGPAGETGKQRAVMLFDLAAAQAPSDAELAMATAGQACDVLSGGYYATALQRVPIVRAALGGTRYVDELDERVRALTSAARENS